MEDNQTTSFLALLAYCLVGGMAIILLILGKIKLCIVLPSCCTRVTFILTIHFDTGGK